MIEIKPILMGLNLGEVDKIKITVPYEIKSNQVTLQCYAYNSQNKQINLSPINLDVPIEVLQEWNFDFTPVILWTIDQLGVELKNNTLE
jgi:hypothetical protein